MKTRWVLYLAVGIVVIGMVAAAAMVVMVKSMPLERMKAFLADQVQSATGRTLTLAGPVEVKFGLIPSVVARDITLANPPGATRPEMLKISRLAMEIELMPLLNKEIVVQRLILAQPDILIETEAKGPGNLEFRRPGAKPEAKAAEGGTSGPAYRIALNEVQVKGGTIKWVNRTTATTATVAIEQLTLAPDQAGEGMLAIRLVARAHGNTIRIKGATGTLAQALAGSTWPVRLEAEAEAGRMVMEGVVADLPAWRGLDIRVMAQGEELGKAIGLLAPMQAGQRQALGPYRLSTRLRDTDHSLNLTELTMEAGKRELVWISGQGGVADLAGAAAVDLRLTAHSDKPAGLGQMTATEVPLKGPVSLKGRLSGSGLAWKLTEMDAAIGSSDLRGELAAVLDKRPRISGSLNAGSLNGADFMPSAAAARVAKNSDGRLIPDLPLPVAVLNRIDLDLALQAEKFVYEQWQLAGVAATFQLIAGRLTVKPFRFGLAGGIVEGEATLDGAAKAPVLALRLNGRQVELGRLVQHEALSGGKSDVRLDLRGSGTSLRQVLASASGETMLSVGRGRLRNRTMGWVLGDFMMELLSSLNPLAKAEEVTVMECAVARFHLGDGLATTSKGLAMRTDKVDVIGSGTINLRTEGLDLGFIPKARQGLGVSLSTRLADLIRVRGTLARPAVGVDPQGTLRTAASVGAGVATGGLSVLGELLVEKVTGDNSDPCRAALDQAQTGQSGPAKERNKSGPAGLLQDVFGR